MTEAACSKGDLLQAASVVLRESAGERPNANDYTGRAGDHIEAGPLPFRDLVDSLRVALAASRSCGVGCRYA